MALKIYNSARQLIKQSFLRRSLCSSINDKYERPKTATISLAEPLPDLPKAMYIQKPDIEGKTQVTTLDNGLKVASEPRFGQFCTVGKWLNILLLKMLILSPFPILLRFRDL